MDMLKALRTKVHIDMIALSCSAQEEDVTLPDRIGKYRKIKQFSIGESHGPVRDMRCRNYRWRLIYQHEVTGNYLWACRGRHFSCNSIPAVYLTFFSSYQHPLTFDDVDQTLRVLKKDYAITFQISKIDVAIDLIHPNEIGLHRRVLRAINPKRKRDVRVIGQTTKTLIIGAPSSAHRVTAYDKGQQLSQVKKINVAGDISRIEVRLKSSVLKKSVQTIKDLRKVGWAAPIYGRFFSLDRATPKLMDLLGKGIARKPIRKLKNILIRKFGAVPNNFSRDCIREHNRFGPAIRDALATFKWV